MIEVTSNPVNPQDIIDSVRGNTVDGAVVSFIGSLRELSTDGKPLRYADLELDPVEVKKSLQKIVDEVKSKWKVSDISICQRFGRIEVGDAILVVAISAPHRGEAFEACQYTIDCAKELHNLREVV
ncbi:MAG: molybdenum cofactor biosynthesis protein MoaE [Chloroflexota bacterium]|nr:molybdenum cofactor biosynthesis protein MoaE [Chloroflexota bacterium]